MHPLTVQERLKRRLVYWIKKPLYQCIALCAFDLMAAGGGGVFLSTCDDSGASFLCASGNPLESLHTPITEVPRRPLFSDQFQILINSKF